MKSLRILLTSLAAVALVAMIAGCGKSTSPTSAETPVVDNAPPAAPTNLGVTINTGTGLATLHWDASTDANTHGYDIFAYSPAPDQDLSYTQIGQTDATTLTLPIPGGYQKGLQYFKIQASNTTGSHSPYSALLQVALPGPIGSVDTPAGGGPKGPRSS